MDSRASEDGRPGGSLAKALGWASVGLGLPQVAAPGRFARLVGLDDTPGTRRLTRGVGLRELGAAAGVLAKPAGGLWARVAGDAMDLALLGNALRSRRSDRRRVAAATAAVVGIAALDVAAAARLSRRTRPGRHSVGGGAIRVSTGITVNKPAEDLHAFWRDFSRLPEFMTHLESVEPAADGRSHWVASAPVGSVEWDAQVVEDVPGEVIAWRSTEGATVPNSGAVRFRAAPAGRGTEVRVELTYEPPAGALGSAVAKLLGEEPQQQVEDDLRRFKQVVETGEVVRSEGSPEGHRTRRLLAQRPGQPVA
jgi:uncharacterized membrane protein